MVPQDQLIALYTHAAVFVCPSVYEPFGIINLEAMACGRRSWPRRSAASWKWSHDKTPGCWCRFEPVSAADVEPRDPGAVLAGTWRRR